MMKKIKQLFVVLILLTFVFPVTSFAQNTSSLSNDPDVRIIDIRLSSLSYNIGDVITGEFGFQNKEDFDIGNVYYQVALLGKDGKETPVFITAYDFGELQGPFHLNANSVLTQDFSFNLPKHKLSDLSAIRIQALLPSGFSLGRGIREIELRGNVLPRINLINSEFNIGTKNISSTQTPVIYRDEKARFKYTLINTSSNDVVVEPQVTIVEKRDPSVVLAKYSEEKILIKANGRIVSASNINTFNNEPGVYSSRINFVDSEDRSRSAPVVFSYVVDGVSATIEGILTDNDGSVRKGDNINVIVSYTGKPIDIRNIKQDSQIKDVSVFVQVTDDSGKIIAEETVIETLGIRGELPIDLTAKKGGKNLNVRVLITKDGETFAEETLNVPVSDGSGTPPLFMQIAILLVILGAVAFYVFHKKHAAKIAIVLAFTFGVFGFAGTADAYTVVYTVGDEALLPTNVEIYSSAMYSNPETMWTTQEWRPYVHMPQPPSPEYPTGSSDGNVYHTAYNVVSVWPGGENPNYYSRYHRDWSREIPDWEPELHSSPGQCDSYSCDAENLDYWDGFLKLEPQQSGNGEYIFSSYYPYSAPGTTEYRAYFYIRNDNYVTVCDENNSSSCSSEVQSVAMLVYEDFEFLDPYSPPNREYCYASVDGGTTIASSVAEGESVTWHISPFVDDDNNPEYSCDSTFSSCVNGIDYNKGYYRWSGETGEDAIGSQDHGGNVYQEIYDKELVSYPTSFNDHCSIYNNSDHNSTLSSETGMNGWTDYSTGSYSYNSSDNVCRRTTDWSKTSQGEDVCTEEDIDGDGVIDTTYCEPGPDVVESGSYVQDSDSLYSTQLWGSQLATSYISTDDVDESGFIQMYFEILDSNTLSSGSGDTDNYSNGSWAPLSCLPLSFGSDLCGNIDGVQTQVPTGFDVYPDPTSVDGVNVLSSDLNCFPVELAERGTITLQGVVNPADTEEVQVDWSYEISADYFSGVLNGILYTIPRFADITWQGNLTDLDTPNTWTNFATITPAYLSELNTDESVDYTESGSATVSITISDPYAVLFDSQSVVISPPECDVDEGEECYPECIPGVVPCDNGHDEDNANVDDFAINPTIANTNDQCKLSWTTNSFAESCNLIGPLVTISVATSSVDYLVTPGSYVLSCVNYVPETTIAGPVTCLENPDVKEE